MKYSSRKLSYSYGGDLDECWKATDGANRRTTATETSTTALPRHTVVQLNREATHTDICYEPERYAPSPQTFP